MSDAEGAGAGTRREALRLMWWLVVPVLVLLAVLSQLQYEQRFAHAERDLLVRAAARARELEALARPAEDHISDLRQLLQAHWHEPPRTGPAFRLAFKPWLAPAQLGDSKTLPPDGWTLDRAPDDIRRRYGQVWWAPVGGRPPDGLWMDRAALFLRSAAVVHDRSPGFEGSYFVAAELNVSWGFPWIDTPTMLSSMGRPSLQAMEEVRVAGVVRSRRLIAADPTDITYWGRPYVGQLDGELVQSHGAALVVDGQYAGEVSVDFRVDTLQQKLASWQPRAGGRIWITDRQHNIVADSQQPLEAPAGKGLANQPMEIKLQSRLPAELAAQPLDLKPGAPADSLGANIQRAGPWLLVSATRNDSPWVYAQIMPRANLRAEVLPTLLPNAVLGLALFVVFIAGQWLFARWFVTPALGVLQYLRQVTADPSTPEPRVAYRWRGWVRAVTQTVKRQQEAQTQLEHQRETLRQNEKLSAMGTLLASVAHELNNPLAIVMGRASLMEERLLAATDADSPAALTVRDDSRRIREAADRCSRIVRTFLNMARQRPPTRTAVPLGEVIRSALDMLGYTLRNHGVHVQLRLADGLPLVQVDPDQIGQVVLNLIVNADQAMAPCSAPRVLTLSTGQDTPPAKGPRTTDAAAYVWLRVADTGPGVAAAHQFRVFEPFFTTKELGMGTGLGLSVSRRIAREHDGDLVLEPSDSGAVFCLRLPVALGDRSPAPAGEVPTVQLGDAADPRRILVVDGEPPRVAFIRCVLESAGYEVASAESGAVAMELLDAARFDAVISNMYMSDLDGLALWQAIHKVEPELATRMVFITDEPVTADAGRILVATGRSCVKLPLREFDLLRAMKRMVPWPPTGG